MRAVPTLHKLKGTIGEIDIVAVDMHGASETYAMMDAIIGFNYVYAEHNILYWVVPAGFADLDIDNYGHTK